MKKVLLVLGLLVVGCGPKFPTWIESHECLDGAHLERTVKTKQHPLGVGESRYNFVASCVNEDGRFHGLTREYSGTTHHERAAVNYRRPRRWNLH